MIGIRHKLVVGFGVLLIVLVSVGLVGRWSLRRFSGTLEKVFRENYDSVLYGQAMRDAADKLDDQVQGELFGAPVAGSRTSGELIGDFETALARERGNITLPGERELVADIDAVWGGAGGYRAKFESLHKLSGGAEKQALYRAELFPLSTRLKESAQKIVEINVRNMGLENGEVKRSAGRAETTLYVLVGSGLVLGVVVVVLLGRSILTPLKAVTESAAEIERGNLDLIVPVTGRDEVGQLAETFNRMAGKLRELRRTDRAKLVRTQRTTSLALGSLPDAVAIVSPEGKVEIANDAAERLFGLRAGQLLTGPDARGLSDLFRRAVAEGRPIQSKGYDAAIQIFNGSERFFLPTAVPILDEERNLAGVTLVLADVTNLRKLDEMKSGLLAVVSHELKTPLTSIRMATHLLLEERVGALSAKQQELLTAAREDADKLSEIIENLLDIGRIESGRALVDARRVSAGKLVQAAVQEAMPGFRDKGVKLEMEVPGDVADVSTDPDRVGFAFSNLLSNALKYTDAGGRVVVHAEPGEGSVRFSVTDTGTGIAEEALPHLFDRFYRAPNQPPGRTGVGLGLAIAKEIIEASGGRIGVESKPGMGSTFFFTLPVADSGTVKTDGPGGVTAHQEALPL